MLDRVLDAFWRSGYEATSMADLCAATGLQKGSLYKAFGDKHGLYLRALDRYLDAAIDRTTDLLLASDDARAALATWVDGSTANCGVRGQRRGCLAVNALVELGPCDQVAAKRLERHFERLERVLAAAIDRGRAQGTIDPGVEPALAAASLVTVVCGLLAGGRGAAPADRTGRVARHAIDALLPAPA